MVEATLKQLETSLGWKIQVILSSRPFMRSPLKFIHHLKARLEKRSGTECDIFLWVDLKRQEWVYLVSPEVSSQIKGASWKVIHHHLREELQGTHPERAVSENLKLFEALALYSRELASEQGIHSQPVSHS